MNLFCSSVLLSLILFSSIVNAESEAQVLEIIRRADDIRSPNKPFRYTVTILAYKAGAIAPSNKQILDISMRFLKPENAQKADARSLIRFIYPARDKGKVMLSHWYDLWFYTPELRRPIRISRSQRLLGQISNADVIVTNFEYSYDATLIGEVVCGDNLCYQLALARKSPQVTYPKVIYWVEKECYRPFKVAYYSLDNKLIKEVLYQDYQLQLGQYRPAQIVVIDARYGQAYSVMRYSDVRFESLPLSHFTKEYIQRGGL